MSLDACHIKARYGGVVLVLTVLDGNGNIFPAAIAIAESENEETWSLFLFTIRVVLHVDNGGEGLVVLSDREKGIYNALKKSFPPAQHSFCVFHIQKNVKTAYKTALNGLLFKAAKAHTRDGFHAAIAEMKQIHQDAGEYVEKIRPEKWARSFFPLRRFGHVTSNIAESMNHWLDDARYLDPVGLFCAYIRKLNQLFEKRRTMYQKMTDKDLPQTLPKLSNSRWTMGADSRFSPTPPLWPRSREKQVPVQRVLSTYKVPHVLAVFTPNLGFPADICVRQQFTLDNTPKRW